MLGTPSDSQGTLNESPPSPEHNRTQPDTRGDGILLKLRGGGCENGARSGDIDCDLDPPAMELGGLSL